MFVANYAHIGALVLGALASQSLLGQSQTFSSGSTGADGALSFTTPGTVLFNPKSFNPPLDPEGDNIFHFTTITIGSGVTLRLTESVLHGPVYFLASGDVNITGTIDLTGEAGINGTANQSDRLPTYAGSGGYGGGLGGGLNGVPAPGAGNGPGGGTAGTGSATPGNGRFTANQFLVPLIGGSGGGGAYYTTGCGANFGGSGGAGGGAILIASSTTISVTGVIQALGGRPGGGGCQSSGIGSGGAIRLVSTANTGSGTLTTDNGFGSVVGGYVRVEAYQQNYNGNIYPAGRSARSVPFALALPMTPASSISVTSVNGIPINANPFTFPDATINATSPVIVAVQARYIPTGTIPTLTILSESGPDQVLPCSALQGTLPQSTCTVSVSFPTGGSRGFVKATW